MNQERAVNAAAQSRAVAVPNDAAGHGVGVATALHHRRMIWVARVLAVAVFLMGMTSLFGGLFLFDPLATWVRGAHPLKPNASILFIVYGLAAALTASASRRSRRLGLVLALAGIGWSLLTVLNNFRSLGFGFDDLFLNRWTLSEGLDSLRVREYPAASGVFSGLLIMLVNIRPTLLQDAVVHAMLCFVGTILTLAALPWNLDRSVTQISVRVNDVSAQALAGAGLLLAACVCLWWVRRQEIATRLRYRIGRHGLSGTGAILVLASLASFGAFVVWVGKLEQRQRDHLEQVFRLQANALGTALEHAGEVGDLFGNFPGLGEELDQYNRQDDPREAVGKLGAIAMGLARKRVTRVVIFALDGKQIVAVGTAGASAGFDHPLDYDRRLIWSDGTFLRRTVPIDFAGRRVGKVVVDHRLQEFDNVLASAPLFGPTAETLICVPNDVAGVSCLPGRFNQRPYTLERAAAGAIGRAITHAIDGKSGTMISLNARRTEMFSAYGGLAPYPLGMVSQISMVDVYMPVRGSFAWFILYTLASIMMLSVALRSHSVEDERVA